MEMTKCIGLGDPKKVGAFTGKPIEGRECGSKRGPSGHAEGKRLVVFTWRLQEAGMKLREVPGLGTQTKESRLGNVIWVHGGR